MRFVGLMAVLGLLLWGVMQLSSEREGTRSLVQKPLGDELLHGSDPSVPNPPAPKKSLAAKVTSTGAAKDTRKVSPPEQTPEAKSAARPIVFTPRNPRASLLSAHPTSAKDLRRVQRRLQQEPPAVRASLLHDLLLSSSTDDGALRDKLLFFAKREQDAAMLPFWLSVLQRESPRSLEEAQVPNQVHPGYRLEAVDLAVMEQMRALEGLASIGNEQARSILWEVATGERLLPFQSDRQRLAAVRSLSTIEPRTILHLARALRPDDSLRDDLKAMMDSRVGRSP